MNEQQRSWTCPNCNEELGELNGYCVYCKELRDKIVFNPDKYFIREIRIYHISHRATKGSEMTPQEELFSQLFNHEKMLVKDMDILTLRAHREELAKISFEARARLTAVDDEDNDRKKKSAPSGARGFERSVNTDETTTDAINAIKNRQKKLSSKEKMLANLAALYEKSGMTAAEAEKQAASAMGAGKILETIKDKKSKDILTNQETRSPLSQDNGFVIQKSPESLSNTTNEVKSIFNPFEKK